MKTGVLDAPTDAVLEYAQAHGLEHEQMYVLAHDQATSQEPALTPAIESY